MHAPWPDSLTDLCDPKRSRRTTLLLVIAFAAAWMIYGVIAKSSQDINADMAEMVIWARAPALGYPKHPPLLAYVVKLWFSVFPLADWAFTLLAVTTVSAGTLSGHRALRCLAQGEKRAAVPFLLALIPFYTFLGLKFDQNSALIPLWALTLWAFMHSLETRRTGWAVLTGLAAAAAMMTKYWSAFLLVALGAHDTARPAAHCLLAIKRAMAHGRRVHNCRVAARDLARAKRISATAMDRDQAVGKFNYGLFGLAYRVQRRHARLCRDCTRAWRRSVSADAGGDLR